MSVKHELSLKPTDMESMNDNPLNILGNPANRLAIFMCGFTALFFSPIFYWLVLRYELESGAFPVDADSIGIPMLGFLLVWFVGLFLAPTAFLVLEFSLKSKEVDH